jgi:stage V sporulation protein K
MGAPEAKKRIAAALDGVLFIDEAHQLTPRSDPTGAAIVRELMGQAENNRERLTIILAGYKHDIDEELLTFDPGLPSRFQFEMKFEDYTEDQLYAIFTQLAASKKWKFATDDVARVPIRRIARGRKQAGFANARYFDGGCVLKLCWTSLLLMDGKSFSNNGCCCSCCYCCCSCF